VTTLGARKLDPSHPPRNLWLDNALVDQTKGNQPCENEIVDSW
jgi:hypothetical protein